VSKNAGDKPIASGQLFHKYLLDRCQEDFERGWFTKEATAAATAVKASDNFATKAANAKNCTVRSIAPLNYRHPVHRLFRLQVLIPLSLLINIATLLSYCQAFGW
jgi:hypothetical protein